ncbi:hypothetical protein M2283_004952 [Streptomyces pseudovenezuelae]|uniref:Uncharacterized protein n=1 Tax=Streptomyces pseudovenezuelae TaxID=67350 RepID=A0ABT6LP73_9ACTN|nr:hypothetical protein [Streptomyces pseudovenezuelae]
MTTATTRSPHLDCLISTPDGPRHAPLTRDGWGAGARKKAARQGVLSALTSATRVPRSTRNSEGRNAA